VEDETIRIRVPAVRVPVLSPLLLFYDIRRLHAHIKNSEEISEDARGVFT
jgi:hypothetical protein